MRINQYNLPLKFLILLCLIVLFAGTTEADDKQPEYTFTNTGGTVYSTISDNGQYMASVDNVGKLYYYDVLNHTELWSYDTGDAQLYDLDMSSDGGYIVASTAYSSSGASIYLFDRDFTDSEPIWDTTVSSNRISDISISANGKTIAVNGYDNSGERVYVYDVSSSTPLWQTSANYDYYAYATNDVSQDGKYIAVKNERNVISFFSVRSSTPLWRTSLYDCCDSQFEEAVAISWDNKYVVAATGSLDYDKIITINVTNGNVVTHYTTEYSGAFDSISIARDSKTFAAYHTTGRVFVFNMTENTPFRTITLSSSGGGVLDLSGNGKYLSVVTQGYSKLYLYDVENNIQLWYNENNYHWYYMSGPQISINGKHVVIGGSSKTYLYNNSAADSLSIYGYGSDIKYSNPPEFSWIATNDNFSNLKFDVYLDSSTNPTTKVASNISANSYTASGLTEGNTYYWKVVAWNSSSNYSVFGPNKLVINQAPTLSDFTPENNKKWYSESAVLTWSGSDADGDSLTYDVYLHECDGECSDGIDPSTKVASGITVAQHTETGLTKNNSVVWKVVANDGYNITSSSVLEFDVKPKYHDWRATTGSNTIPSTSVSGDGRFILIGSHADNLQLFDYDSGEDGYIWEYDTESDVHEVAISKDGRYFASVGSDGKIYFYETNYTDDDANPIQKWTYSSWGSDVDYLAISGTGDYIVAGSDNGNVRAFNKSSSTPILSFSTSGVYDVAISADGQYFAVCGGTHVSFYSILSSTALWSYSGSGDYGCENGYRSYDGNKIAISDDGNYVAVAVGQNPRGVRAYNSSTGKLILEHDNDEETFSVDISSDGKYIVSGDQRYVRVFELSSATDTYSLKWSSSNYWSYVTDVDISSDGKFISSIRHSNGEARGLNYYSIDSSTPLWEGKPTPVRDWYSVSMSDNGGIMAGTRNYDHETYVYSWEYASNSFLKQFSPANNSLVNTDVSLMWTAAGEDAKDWVYDVYMDTNPNPTTRVAENTTYRNYSATSLTAGTRYYWKVVTKEDGDVIQTSEVWTFKIQQNPSISLSSPLINFTQYHNKVNFVWSGSENLRYLVYLGTESDDLKAQSATWQASTSLEVTGLDSRTQYYFKVGAFDGTNFIYSEVRQFSVGVNTPIWQYTTSSSDTYATSSAISADGNFSVVGFKDGDLRFYNKTSSTPLWTYTAGSEILDVAISDNGSYIVVGSKDDFVYLFYKTNNSYLWKKDLDGDVSAVAISRDGEYIAAGGKDDKVVFFDKDSSTPLWTSDELDDQVIQIVMSHNGSYIVAGTKATGAGEVYFFSKSGGGDYDWSENYGGAVTDLAISKNGENVAVASDDFKVYYYNKAGSELWKYETGSKVLSASIADDAKFLAVASQDKKIYLFNTTSSTPLWSFDMGARATDVEISRDGKYILAGGDTDSIYLLDKASNVYVWNDQLVENINSLSISSDASYILVGSKDDDSYALVNLFGSPYLKWAYVSSSLPAEVDQYTNVTFTGSYDDSANATGYFWQSNIDGLLSNQTSFTTNSLSPGEHTITFQAQYSGSTSNEIKIPPPVDSDTWAMWRFDDGSGTTPQDSSDNNYHMDNMRCNHDYQDWTTDSKYGDYAFEFDGATNTCVGVRTYDQFGSGVPTDLTAEAWIKIDTKDRWNAIYTHQNDGWFLFYVNEDNKLELKVYGDSTWKTVVGSTELDSDTWYHVAATYSATNDRIRVYLDDTIDGTTTLSSSYTMDSRNGYNYVGYDYYFGYVFDGIIDEVRISNVERTDFDHKKEYTIWSWSHPAVVKLIVNEGPKIVSATVSATTIQQWYKQDKTYSITEDTVGYWSFDEGEGAKTYDQGWGASYISNNGGEWVNGHSGTAIELDGIDDFLSHSNYAYHGTEYTEFTAEFWIYLDHHDTSERKYIYFSESPFIRIETSPNDGFYVYISQIKKSDGSCCHGRDTYMGSTSDITAIEDEWHHIALTYSGLEGNQYMELFIDGVSLEKYRWSNTGDFYLRNTCCQSETVNFDGIMDDIRFSKTVLLPSEFVSGTNNPANLTLESTVTDSDGYVANYTWLSDVDGVIGYGSKLSINVTTGLSAGYHNITLRVKDNDGYTVTSSPKMVRIKAIPVVTIDSITPNAAPKGTSISLAATATDNDGSITKYQWRSDLDGLISTTEDFSTTSLSPGYHNITFRAKDQDGYWSFRDYEHVLVTGIEVTPDFGVQGSGSFNPSFNYSRQITLAPATSITDSVVNIVLDTSNFNYSHVKSDGSDIRFYGSSGDTKYSYWIEKWDNTGTSTILVKIPVSGTSNFLFLYGSSDANSESNATSVFTFYDDFSGDSINSDLWEGDTDNFDVCSGALYPRYSSGHSCGWGYNENRLSSKINFTGNYVAKTRVYTGSQNWGGYQALGWFDDTCDNIGAGFWQYEVDTVVFDDCNEHSSEWRNFAGQWLQITLVANGSNSMAYYYSESGANGAWPQHKNVSIDNGGLDQEVLALGRANCECRENDNYYAMWDWIYVYEHDPLTPVVTIGSSESPNFPFGTVSNNITFNITVADSYSLITNYTWISSKDGYLGNTSSFTLNASTLNLGNHTISFRLKDSSGSWSGWSNFTYQVYETPTVASMNISAWMDDQGDRVFFNGTGSDTDGTIVRYRWTSSIDGFLSTQASFNTTSLSPGNHTIEFAVQDNSTLWSSKSDRWLYINDQPIATIVSVSPTLVYTNGTITPSKPEVDSNTINMWRFDEGSGSSTSDDGSNGWSGTLYNSPTWVTGKSGYALDFDGDNDYVRSQSSTSSNTGEVTIEAWIYFEDDFSDENILIQWGTVPAKLSILSNEKLQFRLYTYNGYKTVIGSTTLQKNTWYHVAGTFSETNDVMKVYVNGFEDGTYSLNSDDELDYNWGSSMRIGADCSWWSCYYFDGIIDEVRISNIARTSFNTPDNITFNGSATDQSGSVEAYSWTSSIDGELSTQAIFTIHESNLSFGNHTISFKAQDETGAWSVPKTTNVIVRSFPYAKITSIDPWYVNIGTQVNFTAIAIAPDSANLTEYLWWSSIDGNLNTNLTFNSTELSYGNHTILFKAKNSRGEWSQPYFANDGVSFVLVNDIPVASINDISPNPATKGEGRAPPVDQYTIGYWPFREGTGTETIDESGQNNNATLKGSQFETGIWDSSVYFDGSSDYLYVTEGDALSNLGDSDFTLEAWIYPTRSMTSGKHSIIRNDGDYNLFVDNGRLKAEVWVDGERHWMTSTEDYMSSTNTWYHVAAVWDSDDEEWTLYVDGDSQTYNSDKSDQTLDDYPLRLGSTERYSDQAFKGKIDEVRISSTERSSSSLLYYTTLQSTIEFLGSGSDGDGTIEGYHWKSSIEGELSTSEDFSLSAANFTVDSHTISYKVQDDDGVWSPWATSSLDVRSYPTSQIVSISPNSTSEGLSVSFTGNASDPDSSETFVTYRWWSSIDGWLNDSKSFSYSDWSPGNHTIYLQVKDNQSYWSMPVSSELFINDVPTASIDSITPSPAYNNNATYTTVTFNGTVLDGDGSITTYYWSSSKDGELSTSSDFVVNVNTLSNGNHTITFRGKDNYGAWSPNVTTYLDVFENPNATIDSVSSSFVNQYATLWLNGTGSDTDGSITNYTWTSSIDGLIGTFEDVSLSTLTPGNHTITFKVKDNSSLWSTGATTNVEINARPIVTLEATIPLTIYGFSGSTSVQDPDEDTLAFWHLDETTGNTAYDSSSSEKHGDLKNSPSWQTGLYANGLEFDGTDDYVEVPELVTTGNRVFDVVTIEAWVKLKSGVDEDDEWIIFASGKDGILKIGINDDEEPFIFIDESGSFDSKTVTSSEALVSGYWYHLAGIYDSDNDLIQIYLNHKMVANSSIETNYVLDRAATARNAIGSSTGGSQDFFYGTIDEMRISDIKRNTSDMISRSDASYLLAFANDADDNIESMKWRSSIDSLLSDSNWLLLEASDLQAGTHNITFRAKDPHGFWSEYVNFTLYVKMYPRASITSISPNSTDVGDTITFTATSSDSDGSVVEHRWRSSKDGELNTSENFTSSSLSAGYHRITYQVKDNEGLWSVIETSEIFLNEIPTASIGSLSQQVAYKNNLTHYNSSFYGNVSDNDGSITHYYWNSSKDGVLSTSGNFTINVNTLSLGNHTITFQGRDNYTTWSPKVSSWIVIKAYPNATITSVSPRSADEGVSVSFSGSGSDEDGTITGYEWTSSRDGLLSSSSSFSTTNLSTGYHRIYFKVKDNDTLWSLSQFSSVFINDIPEASIDSFGSNPVYKNNQTVTTVSINGSGEDKDGRITHYYWNSSKDGTLSTSGNFTAELSGLSVGNHTIYLQVRDNYTSWSQTTETWLIVKAYPNATISSVSPSFANESDVVTFSGSGSDEDGTITGYEWNSSIDGLIGTLSGFTFDDLSPGNHTIYFKVKDNDSLWSTTDTTNIFVNGRPVVDIIATVPSIIFGYSGNVTLPPSDADTLGYWHMDDGSGTRADDVSSNSNHGTLKNGAAWGTGLFGDDVELDGNDDYILLPDMLGGSSVFTEVTFEAWINLDSSVSDGDDMVIFSGGQDGFIELGIDDEQYVYFKVKSGSFGWKTVTSNMTVASGTWYHIAAQYSESDDFTKIYINRQLVGEYDLPSNFVLSRSISAKNCIGAVTSGSSACSLDNFQGSVDEFRISTSIRSVDSFVSLYDTTFLSATASDYENSITEIIWISSIDGPFNYDSSFLISATTLSPGNHTITFGAKDNYGFWSNNATVSLYVRHHPRSSIDSISHSSTDENVLINFTGVASDTDGSLVRYEWHSSRDGVFATNLNVTTGNLSVGYHVISFKVKDNDGLWSITDFDSLFINDIPTASIGSLSQHVAYKNNLTHYSSSFYGNVSDNDGSITHYYWNSSKDGVLSTSGNFTINVNTLSLGNHTITFQGRDNYTTWSPKVSSWIVIKAYPNATIVNQSSYSIDYGDSFSLTGNGSDEDGTITGYEWTSSRDGLLSTNSSFETTSMSVGFHWLTFKVKDNDTLWSLPVTTPLSVNDIPVSIIHNITPQIAYRNNLTHYNVSFAGSSFDKDGRITNYYWNSSKDGVLSNSGNFTINVNTLSLGYHNITFQGSDNGTAWSPKTSSWLVVKAYPNATIAHMSDTLFNETKPVTFEGSGSDEDGTIYGYEWTSSINGFISNYQNFTITTLSPGDHLIYLKVKDNDSLWSREVSVNLTINGKPVGEIVGSVPNTIFEFSGNSTIAGPDENTIAFWHFDESDGTKAFDSSVNANDAQLFGPVFDSGLFGNSVELDGVDDYLSVPAMKSGAYSEFTFEAWIWLDNEVSSDEKSVIYSGGKDGTIEFGIDDNQQVFMRTQSTTFGWSHFNTNVNINPEKWYHVAFVYSDQSDFVKIYVNHRLAMSESINSNYELKLNIGNANRIGIGLGNSGNNFGGLIDEFKISDKAIDEFIHGHDIAYFSADAYDFEDSVSSVYWTSSIDGDFSFDFWWQFNSDTLSFGNHTITFYVEDEHGVISDAVISYLNILAHPESSILSVSSQALDYGIPLSFSGRAEDEDGNGSSSFVHEWKSDIDGVFSNELSPSSVILSPGYHTITFKIKDEDGLWSITDTTFVLVNDLPLATIESVGPNPAYKYNETEQMVALIGLAIDNDGNITSHFWNSSIDGIIGYDNLSYVSANNLTVGNHTISYQCRDDFGTWSDTVTTYVLIQSHPRSYIQNITPGFQAEDEPVQFIGDGTDEDGTIQFYRWYSSIDGLIGVLPNFNTTELSPGNHTISFKVKDDNSLWSDYETTYVVINSRPTVELINSVPELIYAYGPDKDLQVADIYTLGYWHFDDVYDNKANDSSFYNNDISVQGNPTVSSGLFGSSLDLDGSLDSFSTPQMVPGGAFDEVTVESWIYLTSDYNFDRNRVIFAGGWDGHLEVGISVNSEAYVSVSSDNFGTIQLFSENEINKLQWYHIAVVYSEQNDEIRLYINGVFDSSIVLASQFELSRSALVENCIGASSGCSGRNFIGLIDEVRITRTLLYPEQFLYREDSAYVSAIAVDYDSTITGGIWESDIDGVIGTDLWLSKNALDWTPGLHNLTFRAVDEYNVWSINYTTQLYVSTYPVVSNLSLESVYTDPVDQEMVWFNGSVNDYDGGSLINFQWFSSIDGSLGESLNISKRLSNGSHEIRFRAQDNEGHWSAWEYRNYFVDVHPIYDIQMESQESYRGYIMPIFIKIGDNLTLQSQFTVEIEINGTGLDWSKQYMVQPEYNGELWEGYFSPSLDMQPGNYQIRGRTIQDQARSTHDEIRTTPWIHLLDVQVINNAPVIKEVIFSNTTLGRNQETSIELNITDLESSSDLSVLDVNVFYFDKLEEEWLPGFFSEVYYNESSGLFEVTALPPSNLKVGKYDFKLQVIDLDGEIVDLIEDKYFTVVNSQPIVYDVDEEILENYQQGNSTFWVNVTSNDFDGDIYRYEWRSNRQGALPCVTDECELDPSNLLPGVHEIRVYAVDEDEELSEPLIFEIVVLEEVYEEGSDSILADVYNSIFEGNPLLLGGALIFGLLSVLGTLRLRKREEVFVEEEFEDVLPRDPVEAWLPPLELNDHEAILAEFFVKRRESYLAYPKNEDILDFLHNNRERYTISSYFEVPTSPTELLHEWALPANLRYNVHLDDVRKSIVNTILDDTTGKNFVIIGEPGVGKSVIGFDVFDRLMDRMPVGRITTYSVGNVHEKFGIRLFYDDIPENPELIQVLQERKLRGLVVTAREADWRSLPKEFQNMFERLTVPLFSEDEMLNLASRMLAFSGLMYEPQALDKLAVYSEGSPIYVWSLIRELVSKDVKKLTLTYLNENSMKGMTNYVSLLLQQLLKDAGQYKAGGYHTLSAVNFLSTHMAEKNSHELFFRAFSEQLSEHTTKIFNDEMDTMTFNHAMGYLSGEGSQVRFPHDTWADVLEGEGSMNPFRAEIQTIDQEFADTGLFETVKRAAVPKAWETAVSRYKKSPSRQHEALLALADTLFRNFGVKDLTKLGVDSDLVLEVATTYSHLPLAAMLVSKIQAATPQQVTKIINIQDTVSEQKGFGDESSHPPYTMEELYLVYNDGRLISSEHSREAKVDSDIMSSMLTAINDFVKDSFQTEGNLGAIDYGENKIILERGDNTVLAAVVYGEATRDLRSKMGSAVREIEEKFGEDLASWDGDIDKLSETKETLSTIIELTDGVTRDMIEDYLSMQEVRIRSTNDEFKGFLETKAHINNYASKDIQDVILGLDYNKSKLKLVKVFPTMKHDNFKINIDKLRGYNDLEVKLYFEVLNKKNIGLNFRLDYTNPRGEGSQVSSTPCDGLNFKTSVKKPKIEDLEFEEEIIETPVEEVKEKIEEKVETIESDFGDIEVLEANVEEIDVDIEEAPAFETIEDEPEVEEKVEEEVEEVEEPVDLGESGMDDLLGKLGELGSEDSSKDESSKKSKKKDSDEEMDDLMGKLDEL